MELREIEQYILSLFNTKDNELFYEESGITVRGTKEVKKIGYCTNLTIDTIEEARKNDVDLIITHHDAWEFIYGLKEACKEKLLKYNISHYFNHLPLDDCDFGTNNSLIKKLGLEIIERTHEEDKFFCGRGGFTTDVREAVERNCDVYITGEKVLYTIEYAKFAGINLIVGSHTFTEIFGVESLAMKIKDKYKNIEVVRLKEEHLEAIHSL